MNNEPEEHKRCCNEAIAIHIFKICCGSGGRVGIFPYLLGGFGCTAFKGVFQSRGGVKFDETFALRMHSFFFFVGKSLSPRRRNIGMMIGMIQRKGKIVQEKLGTIHIILLETLQYL